jgi:precorrin-6B methylase 2
MISGSTYHYGSVILLVLVILAALSIIIRTLLNTAPPMPTSARVRARLIELIRQLHPHGTIVELGSGWGTLSLPLARTFPDVSVIGYENSPVPLGVSRIRRRLFGSTNLRFLRKNFYKVPLNQADMVVCYLSPEAMRKLQPKFTAELKPGAIVVSSTFALPVWKADQVIVTDDMYRTRIYVYSAGGESTGLSGHASRNSEY